jgi:hypothetical protein
MGETLSCVADDDDKVLDFSEMGDDLSFSLTACVSSGERGGYN